MRSTRVLETVGCDAFVASDPFTVTWLTGFAADETWGPNPFAVAPLAVVRPDGSVVAIVSEDEAPALAGCRLRGRRLRGLHARPARRLRGAAGGARVARPAAAGWESRTTRCPCPARRPCRPMRMRCACCAPSRTHDEIERMRAAIRICDTGQAAARGALRDGVSELEAWGAVQTAMQIAAGERLSLLCDFATGERTADVGGPPGPRVDAHGRSRDRRPRAAPRRLLRRLLLDGRDRRRRPRRCARRTRAAARRSSAVSQRSQPGLVAGDLDTLVREGLDYPHHSGHGVGVAPHEEPRIVPGSTTVLAPGMIVALEPGAYPGPWGLRVERLALVTETGSEIAEHARPRTLTVDQR